MRTVTGVPDDQDLEDYRVWAPRAGDNAASVYVATSLESVRTPSPPCAACCCGVPLTALLALLTWTVATGVAPGGGDPGPGRRHLESNLSRRVPEPPGGGDRPAGPHDERDADRLEAASRRQRAFAADASHELQSPYPAADHLEVAMSHRHDRLGGPAVDLWSDGAEMERLVRDLCSSPATRGPRGVSSRSGRSRRRGARGGCTDQGRAGCRRPGCRRRRSAAAGSSSSGWCATYSRTPNGMPDPSRGQRVRRPDGVELQSPTMNGPDLTIRLTRRTARFKLGPMAEDDSTPVPLPRQRGSVTVRPAAARGLGRVA